MDMAIKNIDTGTSTYIGEPLDSIGSNRGIKGMHCNSFYLSSNEACSERGRENAKNVEMGETSTLRPIVIKKVETLWRKPHFHICAYLNAIVTTLLLNGLEFQERIIML